MAEVHLTPEVANGALPQPEMYELRDLGLPGFGMRVHPTGKKAWGVNFRIRGDKTRKQHRITLGHYPAMSLIEARNRAEGMLAKAAQGIAPVRARFTSEGRHSPNTTAVVLYLDNELAAALDRKVSRLHVSRETWLTMSIATLLTSTRG